MKLSLTLAGFLFSMALIAHATGWEVNQPFPSLTLPTIHGEASPQVTDFRGDKLMLHIFASW